MTSNVPSSIVVAERAGEASGFEHAVDVDGEFHLHGVGFFVGERQHADDGFAFVDGFHAPIDALFAAGRNFDGLLGVASAVRAYLPSSSSRDFHLLCGRQVVVNVALSTTSSRLDEEPRRLHADDEILARDDFGRCLADARAWPMPQARIFHAVRFCGMSSSASAMPSLLVSSDGGPESGVGEFAADGRLRERRGRPLPRLGAAAMLDFVGVKPLRCACRQPQPSVPRRALQLPSRRSIMRIAAAALPDRRAVAIGADAAGRSPRSSSSTCVAEDAEVFHADLAGRHEVVEPAVEIGFDVRAMLRRHFQKNSLMSPTFVPPEMYSTLLSKIDSTVEPTYGLPSASVSFTVTLACWPGLYSAPRRRLPC